MARRMKFALRIALGAAFAALVVCGNVSAARAGDDDDPNESFTDKFLRTLGLKNPGSTEYEINYSERSPLVVPPNAQSAAAGVECGAGRRTGPRIRTS